MKAGEVELYHVHSFSLLRFSGVISKFWLPKHFLMQPADITHSALSFFAFLQLLWLLNREIAISLPFTSASNIRTLVSQARAQVLTCVTAPAKSQETSSKQMLYVSSGNSTMFVKCDGEACRVSGRMFVLLRNADVDSECLTVSASGVWQHVGQCHR